MAPVLPANVNEFSEEIREASPANFLIKIESFSSLSEYAIDKYESRPFEAGGYKWKLVICFEGNEESHVSAYFSMVETESDSLPEGWEFNACCSFFVYNQLLDNYLCFRGTTRRFNAVNPKWGLSKLISKRDFQNCVFGAEVLVIKTQRVNEYLSVIKGASSYKRDWKISNFSKLEDEVWNSEEFEVGGYNWKVTLYPKGNSSAKDRHMSMYVECVDLKDLAPHRKVKAKVIMRIESKLNKSHHSVQYTSWFSSSDEDWGIPEYIAIGDMSSKGFLVDDCLLLEVEITVQALALDAPNI